MVSARHMVRRPGSVLNQNLTCWRRPWIGAERIRFPNPVRRHY